MTGSRKLGLLALLLTMTACSTLTTEVQQAEKTDAAEICTIWLPQFYDSQRDTIETIDAARAANRRRGAFCA